jgi:protein associated with RNAse G/E
MPSRDARLHRGLRRAPALMKLGISQLKGRQTMNIDRLEEYRNRQRYVICDILMQRFPDMKLSVVDVGADFFKNRHHWHHFDPSRLKIHVFDVDKQHNTAEAELDQRGIDMQSRKRKDRFKYIYQSTPSTAHVFFRMKNCFNLGVIARNPGQYFRSRRP